MRRKEPKASDQDNKRRERIDSLADQLRRLQRSRRRTDGPGSQEVGARDPVISTGSAELDAIFPEGGLRRGTLVEWLTATGSGSGAMTLALLAARCLAGQRGGLVVIDQRQVFYPAAAAALGIGANRTLIVRPREGREWLWAVEQVLRNRAVGVVLTWVDHLEDLAFRRWQLAAEVGGVVGMLVRPCRAIAEPSWASVRLLVRTRENGEMTEGQDGSRPGTQEREGRGRRWRIRVLRGRRWHETAGRCESEEAVRGVGGDVSLELSDETGRLHLLPRLVPAAPVAGATRG